MKKIILIQIVILLNALIANAQLFTGGTADGFVCSESNLNNPNNFTAKLIAPENNSIISSLAPAFDWSNVWGANSYHFQISSNNDFSDILFEQQDILTSEFQIQAGILTPNDSFFWRVRVLKNSTFSNWSEIWSFTPEIIQDTLNINMNSGWNIISSNILPNNLSLENIFAEIENLLIVKNGEGQIYSPAFGINQIGNWNINQSYYVNVTSPNILQITGSTVNPTENPINLSAGWHLISYLRNSPMLVNDALQSITNNMVLAKDGNGNIYNPSFGINNIGNLVSGKGYWIYISEPTILIYPGN